MEIKVGLVGCGGRGTGAAENCITSAPDVKLVAMADMFQGRLDQSRKYLEGLKHPGVKIEDRNCFVGFDAYRKLIDCGVDLVLLCTPPGFRPQHVEAAVDAGRHVFMEKPIAVDPVGCRRVIAAGRRAAEKKLTVVAGTQYRHHEQFIETVKRIRDGAIGTVRAGRIYYNTSALWKVDRKPGESDMEWQIRNWINIDWLSGDHIVEQHIHTIDVMVWAMGGPPVRAVGSGGRSVRAPDNGNIYDHFAVDYEWPGGVHVLSVCRQWNNTDQHVGAYFHGTKGAAAPYAGEITGPNAWNYKGTATLGTSYVQEHADLIASIRSGAAVNESEMVSVSTLVAIMGRQSAYTGRAITWEEISRSLIDYSPERYEMGPLPARPVPIPGRIP